LKFQVRFKKKKYSHIKFQENPSGGSRVIPHGRTDTQLIVVFRNFSDALKIRIDTRFFSAQ